MRAAFYKFQLFRWSFLAFAVTFEITHNLMPRFEEQAEKLSLEVQTQRSLLQRAAVNGEDLEQGIAAAEALAKEIRNLVARSRENCKKLADDVKYWSGSQFLGLSELSSRISQQEYRIRKKHESDPFVETCQNEIGDIWKVFDIAGVSSWRYVKNSGDYSCFLEQTTPFYQIQMPSTILTLKYQLLTEGFVCTGLEFPSEGTSSGGVVFGFFDDQNFWNVEIEKNSTASLVQLDRIVDGRLINVANFPIIIENSSTQWVFVHYSKQKIVCYLNGKLALTVSGMNLNVLGSVGLFSRTGPVGFVSFSCGPPFFEGLAPKCDIYKQSTRETGEMKMTVPNQFHEMEYRFKNLHARNRHVRDADDYSIGIESDQIPLEAHVSVANVTFQEPRYEGYLSNNEHSVKAVTSEEQPVQCNDYNNIKMDLKDWFDLNGFGWTNFSDNGFGQVAPSRTITPATGSALLLLRRACGKVVLKFAIILGSNSEGGTVARFSEENEGFFISLNSLTGIIELKRSNNSGLILLQSSEMNIQPDLRYEVTVEDKSESDKSVLCVSLNGKTAFNFIGSPNLKPGSVGLWISSGFARFDHFSLSRLDADSI